MDLITEIAKCPQGAAIMVTPWTPDNMRVFCRFIERLNTAMEELLTAGSRDMRNSLLCGSSGGTAAMALSKAGNAGSPIGNWYGFI